MATCGRCNESHPGLACKIPFGRAWKGRAACQIRFRAPNGRELKIEADMSPELAQRLLDLMVEITKAPAPTPAASAPPPTTKPGGSSPAS